LAAPKRSRRPLVIILFRNATSTYNCWERETERWSTTCIKWLLMLRFVVTSIRTAQVTAGSSLSSRLVVQKEKNFLKSHSSQGSSTSAGIIIRMTCIALLVQNTLLGHFRLPLDMILLPFQSLNICPLLPVTLTQFNWAVTYILSIHFFYCCSQISRV